MSCDPWIAFDGLLQARGPETAKARSSIVVAYVTIRYDTIRDAILTCARKPTRVSLIYRTEPTTKKCKTKKKLKSKNGYAQK